MGKLWIKFKEKFHGKTMHVWKHQPVKTARRDVRNYNKYSNPYEHLSIVRTSRKKPKGIRKTKYRGIYE